MKSFSRLLLLLSFLILLLGQAQGQNFTGGFPFYLPPDDATAQRFFPSFHADPIAEEDFVFVGSDGHFHTQQGRIRFFGTNLVAGGAFPLKEKAAFIAARLRKMGFNLVRFHHMDNPWSQQSLFEWGQDTRHLNPVTLDRLDFLLAKLKENGIYANINLHVSRTVTTMDGVPDADSIPNFGKGVFYFDPHLIALQKEFARQLLRHVNPYTGLALADDPVVAMVEITNENSLYRMWRENKLKHFSEGGDLTIRHTFMLDDLWQDYLLEKYGTTAALQSAWNQGVRTVSGSGQLKGGDIDSDPLLSHWQVERHSPASGSQTIDPVNPYSGQLSARVTVTNSDGVNWHIQWKYTGLSLEKDSLYTVRFAARAERTRIISVSVMRDVNPWDSFFSTTVQLTPSWQEFAFSFRAKETVRNSIRLSFMLGEQTGSTWFDDLYLGPAAINGLLPDENLETGTVKRIDYDAANSFTDARVKDMTDFYLSLQKKFFTEMKAYLKAELGVKVPIVGTNWYIGPQDLASQTMLDYADNHAYWDHPQFPNVPWSPTDWLINNTPMVLDREGGTIPSLFGGFNLPGKPFTVSEYNHPFPNRYQTEGVLFLTSYAAFHDADAVMFFDYNSVHDDWETDKINSYFSIHRNTAMMALMPSCARAFREGAIQPSQEPLSLPYSQDQLLLMPKFDDMDWRGLFRFPRELTLEHAVKIVSFDDPVGMDPDVFPSAPQPPYVSDTGELNWNVNGLLTVVSPRFVGVTGFLDQFAGTSLGTHRLVGGSDFATVAWTSLSEDSLTRSKLSLLTVSSCVQNTGMVWDGTRTIHNNWGGPPTVMKPVSVTLQLTIRADSVRIVPLTPTGAEASSGETLLPVAPDRFEVRLDQEKHATVWFGLEAMGSGTSAVSEPQQQVPDQFKLLPCSPNPLLPERHGNVKFRFHVPGSARVTLILYDTLGREIWRHRAERLLSGWNTFWWNARTYSGGPVESGIYFYRLQIEDGSGNKARTGKLIVVR